MGAPSSGLHLGVDGARDFVTRQQFGRTAACGVIVVPAVGLGLAVGRFRTEHVGHVVEHDADAVAGAQNATVTTHALGHEEAAHRERPHHAGGVELDALHVDELRAGPQSHRVAVAGAFPGV